jgi:hypothetical protein
LDGSRIITAQPTPLCFTLRNLAAATMMDGNGKMQVMYVIVYNRLAQVQVRVAAFFTDCESGEKK